MNLLSPRPQSSSPSQPNPFFMRNGFKHLRIGRQIPATGRAEINFSLLSQAIIIAGKDSSDAKPYLEKQCLEALKKLKEIDEGGTQE